MGNCFTGLLSLVINRRQGWWHPTSLWNAGNERNRNFTQTRDIEILCQAIEHGNLEQCKQLLHSKVDPNVVCGHQKSPLYVAARKGYLEICKLLIEHNADPNISPTSLSTPLTIAAYYQHYEVCRFLMLSTNVDHSKVKKNFIELLSYAISVGDMNFCQKLIEYYPDEDVNKKNNHYKTLITVASEHEQIDILEYLLENGAKVSTEKDREVLSNYFSREIVFEPSFILHYLKSRKPRNLTQVGQNFIDIFSYASKYGNLKLCKKLMRCFPDEDINQENTHGMTPLSLAVENEQITILGYLMENGAKVTTEKDVSNMYKYASREETNLAKLENYFFDILCYASQHGDLKVCQKLIQNFPDKDLNKNNFSNITALTLAADYGHLRVLEYLMENGAKVITEKDVRNVYKYRSNLAKNGEDYFDKRFLSLALEMEDLDALEKLTRCTSTWYDVNKPNKDGLTSLYFICKNGHMDLTKKCVEDFKADVNGKGCLAVSLEFYHYDIAQYLIDKGCNVDQIYNGMTALMIASKTSSFESVELLLKNDANADIPDKTDKTALVYALKAGNLKIVELLSSVTMRGLNTFVEVLSESNINIMNKDGTVIKELATVMNRVIDSGHRMTIVSTRKGIKMKRSGNRIKRKNLLEQATRFGNGNLTDYILNHSTLSFSDAMIKAALTNAILSDDVNCCQVLKNYCDMNEISIQLDDIELLVKSRKKTKLLEIFNIESDAYEPDGILSKIPRTKEFPYYEILDDIKELITEADQTTSGRLIKYTKLVNSLHVPVVHHTEEKCPNECSQQPICGRIRDVIQLLKQVLKKMGEEFPIFRNVTTLVVGSLKENTKVGRVDEADILLTIDDENLKKHIVFDRHDQRLKIRKAYWSGKRYSRVQKEELELPEKLKPFVSKEQLNGKDKKQYHGFLDEAKYFLTFMEQFHRILSSGALKLPPGLYLTTEFTPCEVCRIDEYVTPQYVRCPHLPDCQEHHQKRRTDQHYKEKCDCKVYNAPSLTYSKIGLALHTEFIEDDGSKINLDIDINPPSIPVGKMQMIYDHQYTYHEYVKEYKTNTTTAYDVMDEPEFDGSNNDKRKRLVRDRKKLPGWKMEYDKTEDNSEAAHDNDGLLRPTRMRCYNLKDVIVEQCLLFYRKGQTLAGNKLKVYILLKILKKCTDADITSFKMKFAVDRSLDGKRYEEADIGQSLLRVLNYRTMRDKFLGVHPDLTKIGVTGVMVTLEGLEFKGDIKEDDNITAED